LTNAIKFTPEGGKILVSSHYEKGLFYIKIKDSGVVIAKEDLGVIFEEFVQVNGQNQKMGTGLGLAICKRIVDLYNGQIKVESSQGIGSEFTVSLPLKVGKSEIKTAEKVKAPDIKIKHNKAVNELAAEADAKDLLNGKRVLIADDFKMNLLLLSKIIGNLGATCDTAEDGSKAFELFNSNTYNLVITDIQMPNMDGLELTKCIREHAVYEKSRIPILGFTGSDEAENLAAYQEVGIDFILAKPFNEDQFNKILAQLTDRI